MLKFIGNTEVLSTGEVKDLKEKILFTQGGSCILVYTRLLYNPLWKNPKIFSRKEDIEDSSKGSTGRGKRIYDNQC